MPNFIIFKNYDSNIICKKIVHKYILQYNIYFVIFKIYIRILFIYFYNNISSCFYKFFIETRLLDLLT